MYFNDVQIRLIILYTLRSFNVSMTEENLQETLVWSGILDYFTMIDFILDMMKLEMVTVITVDGEQRYDVSKKGLEVVLLFKDKIPPSIRDRIDAVAEETLSKMARGREIVADIVPIDRKKYLAKCGIYESGVPLLEINIFAGTRAHAEEISKRFENEAADLYKIILEKIVE